MKTATLPPGLLRAVLLGSFVLAAPAQAGTKAPTSKLYVADLEGQSEIDTGERIEELSEKSVHNAQGTVIQTKQDSVNAMVFSNGTGIFLDQDTRMEVKKFAQEPFRPSRTDLQSEPSISQTAAFIPRGTVGLCTPRMVAGSTMVYSTPQASVAIRGNKVVIETNDYETKISLVEGDVTVRGGESDGGGQSLRGGQQAIIRQLPGQDPVVTIGPIPDNEQQYVNDKVTLACDARKTVYFDVQQKKADVNDNEAAGVDPTGEGWADVFDEGVKDGNQVDIVPVQVTPVEPAQETPSEPVSPSTIPAPSGG